MNGRNSRFFHAMIKRRLSRRSFRDISISVGVLLSGCRFLGALVFAICILNRILSASYASTRPPVELCSELLSTCDRILLKTGVGIEESASAYDWFALRFWKLRVVKIWVVVCGLNDDRIAVVGGRLICAVKDGSMIAVILVSWRRRVLLYVIWVYWKLDFRIALSSVSVAYFLRFFSLQNLFFIFIAHIFSSDVEISRNSSSSEAYSMYYLSII
ncbi:hypothetical protein Tco_1354351 [Tanacetum coccineum]